MDPIFESFLDKQFADGMALARESDILRLFPLGARPVQKYRVVFRCRTLVRAGAGDPRVCLVDSGAGIHFRDGYLRLAGVAQQCLCWLGPLSMWHPNIMGPFICLGKIAVGAELVGLIHRLYSTITFNNYSLGDPLNRAACPWVRDHPEQFPTDRRPLKRRQYRLRVEPEAREGSRS